MHFKSTSIGGQYLSLHPELRRALSALDLQIRDWGLEEMTLTEALRTPAQQEDIYWERYLGPLVSETEARAKARRRFTWHLFGLAVDIRNNVYTPDDRGRIGTWVVEHYPRPEWEFVDHDTGRGPHFHFGKRDWLWARDWERKNRRAVT